MQPRKYNFTEAYTMIKEGKMMQCDSWISFSETDHFGIINIHQIYHRNAEEGKWEQSSYQSHFSLKNIDSLEWTEYFPKKEGDSK